MNELGRLTLSPELAKATAMLKATVVHVNKITRIRRHPIPPPRMDLLGHTGPDPSDLVEVTSRQAALISKGD